jgi:REP element-mobilizing transposase RayT
MTGPVVTLTADQRDIVEAAIAGVCAFRGWELRKVNCRSNHVHVVVSCCGDAGPDAIMNLLKAYATRALRASGHFVRARVWTRDGSKRHLNSEDTLDEAIQYVQDQ